MNLSYHRIGLAILGCLWLASGVAAEESDVLNNLALPNWIWVQEKSHPASVQLSNSVLLTRAIQSAELRFAADFCHAHVKIERSIVLDVAPYSPTQTLDVTKYLRLGSIQIEVVAASVPGPAAIACSLVVNHQDGTQTIVVSNEKWRASSGEIADRGRVPPELWGIGRRGISLSPFENYEQWQQAKTDSKHPATLKFWTPPHYEVTEVRVAQPDEGSWISLAFDSKGQLLISREDQGFLRMTLDAARKSVERVEPIASELKECRGLAFDGDWLFANANNSLGLYRLQIDEAGKVQKQQLVRNFPGKVGHGRNDIVIPAKQPYLYEIHGDSVELPKDDFRDFTSPLNESKRKSPGREGTLWRMNRETKSWELLSAGLRNPYGIAIHDSGTPFTFDADNEFDMGTPWYRPTRILNLMVGGDTGYRESTGVFPPRFHDQPDHAPPLFDIGRSSPTSVMFGYDLNFPAHYKQTLFALDWTYGRVIAVHLAPRGATYRAAAELFLQGRPLNVTDIAAGPDGSMYLITGGRKTQSALYRVSYTGQPVLRNFSVHEKESRDYSAKLLSEQAPFLRGDADVRPTTGQLTFDDPVIRHAARVALERQELSTWRDETLKAESPNLFALLALARARRAEDVPEILKSLLRCDPKRLILSEQMAWVRIAGLCLETSATATREQQQPLAKELLALAAAIERGQKYRPELYVAPEGTSDQLRQRIVLLLGELGAPELPALVAAQLFSSSQQEDQLLGLLATRNLTKGWTLDMRKEQFRLLNEMPRMIGGAGLPPFEKWLRPQILKSLSQAEATALTDLIELKQEVSNEPLPPPRPHVQKWTLADLAPLHAPDAPAGDAKRGAEVFKNALCSRCHRVNLKGAAVGPDLTLVSRRFSRRDMLESIVSPSLSVAENFRLETILTTSGQVHTGRIVNEGDYRSEKIILQTDSLQPDKMVELDKKEISEHRTTPTSPMPNGLLDTFTLEEIRNLLAYLETGR